MKLSRLAGWVLVCALAAPAAAQATAEQRRLVDQLAGPQREDAHRQLVALGRKTVSALIDGLDDPRPEVVRQVLAILGELGPDAKPAVPVLFEKARADSPFSADCLWSLSDLAPYAPKDVDLGDRNLLPLEMRWFHGAGMPDPLWTQAMSRLRSRRDFPARLGLQDLIATATGFQPYRVERAVELLGQEGSAARSALPALQLLLARRDPRVLMTERTVQVRSKAARAILAIDADCDAAVQARAVLAGSPPAPAKDPVVPARARARMAEVIAELADARKREAAQANLVAFGSLALAPLLAALADDHDADFREAALCVLCELGPRAGEAVPALFELLTKWPAENLLSLMRTLTATAPWCRDALPPMYCSGAVILGHPVAHADAAFCSAFMKANQVYCAVMRVDPGSALIELQQHLGSSAVVTREAALVVLRQRGAAARSLLPVTGDMLDEPQPKWQLIGLHGGEGLQERSDVVHRLAAQAILSIAAPDDPLVAKAREVLAQLPAGDGK